MKMIFFIILFPVVIYCQPMQWQLQGIPVIYNNIELPIPWTGGMTDTKPEFVDIDNDGDYDCFIGDNTGKIWYFENVGTEFEPEWTFFSDYFDSIDVGIWSQPVFCDIDADGDKDLFVISPWSKYYYNNIGNVTSPIFEFIADTLSQINGSTLDFGDFDDDGDYDIVSGTEWYYENIGDSNNFNYVIADTIIIISYATGRCICDLNDDGNLDLIVGEDGGTIWYLRNDGTPQQYNFTVVTQNLVGDVGSDAAPTLVDIDGDGDLDLLVGTGVQGWFTPYGEIRYFENIGTPEVYNYQMITDSYFAIDAGMISVPALIDIDGDNDYDLFIGSKTGHFAFYENIGDSAEPSFQFIEPYFEDIHPGPESAFDFGDLDDDGDYDLLIGWEDPGIDSGKIALYRNDGNATTAQYSLINSNYLGALEAYSLCPTLCDIDNDSDLDLFIGKWDGTIDFFRNVGSTNNPSFDLINSNYYNIDVNYDARPRFYDIDADGDFDMFIGYNDAFDPEPDGIYYYENIGTSVNAIFSYRTDNWQGVQVHSNASAPCFADIDNDTDADLFIGSYDGGVAFWRNLLIDNDVENPAFSISPLAFSLFPCYPNPFNEVLTIPFTIDQALPVKVVVYDALGREVQELGIGNWELGKNTIVWEAGGQTSGVYFVRLEMLQSAGTLQRSVTKKVVLLK